MSNFSISPQPDKERGIDDTCEVCGQPSKFKTAWCGSLACSKKLTPIRLREEGRRHGTPAS